jgi:hypothetical protein
MNPLNIAGHFGEPVDPFLGNGQPGTDMDFLPQLRLQKGQQFIGGHRFSFRGIPRK